MFAVMPNLNAVSFGGVKVGPSATVNLVSINAGSAPAPVSQLSLRWQTLQRDPSLFALLTWHTRISDFAGREHELAQLRAWIAEDTPVSVKFLTGPGGSGKSRLAAELAEGLQKWGWAAGFADLRAPSHYAIGRNGTLLIADYPEDYRAEALDVLRDLATCEHRGAPLRVLFLSRTGIEAWEQSIHDARAAALVSTTPVGLRPLAPAAAHRVFTSAQRKAAEALGVDPPLGLTEEALAEWVALAPEHARALFVLAAALHTVLNPDDDVIRYAGGDVIRQIVDRELSRLRESARHHGFGDPDALARLVALTALAGDVPWDRVAEWAAQPELALGLDSDGPTPLRVRLREAGVLVEGVVNAPTPDMLAAVLAGTVLGNRLESTHAPERVWAAMQDNIAVGLARLGRAAYDAEFVVGWHDAGLTAWLPAALSGHVDRCRAVAPYVGSTSLPLGLVPGAVTVWETLRDATNDAAEKARCLNNLGVRLGALGRREAALAATEEAVTIRRTLAQEQPDAFLPDLAMSLNNLGGDLSALGRREAALAAIEEAVTIRRTLAQARPDAFLPNLANCLNNLGIGLSELGRREAALAATEEAVMHYRTLAQAQPDAFLPDLAGSLNSLGIRLSALGRREAALAATEEAVTHYRTLAQARPDAFLPDVAMSLNNLGNRLSALGRREAALAATEEAVTHCRTLAQARPDAFLPDLAGGLNNLGIRLSGLGRREAALAATEEAVTHYRTLAQARPDAFLPDVAMSLNNLGAVLSALGRGEAALAAAEEAVMHCRTLAEARPDAFLPDLAGGLNNLGGDLSALGRREAALAAIEEAVTHYRTLAQARPDAFLPDVAMSLNNLGNRLSALGRREAALAATEEAVTHYRTLAQARPDAFLPDLAKSLNNLGADLSELGRLEDARAATEEAAAIHRRLAGHLS